MTVRKLCLLPIAAGVLLTACVAVPTGPSVMVLPGSGKDFEQFRADDAVCRQWALQQTGTTTAQASTDTAVSGAAVGTVLGAATGAAVGAASGRPAMGAAVGSGIGLLAGRLPAPTAPRAHGGRCSAATTWRTCSACTLRATRSRCPAVLSGRPRPRGNSLASRRTHAPADVPPPPIGSPPPPPPGPSW